MALQWSLENNLSESMPSEDGLVEGTWKQHIARKCCKHDLQQNTRTAWCCTFIIGTQVLSSFLEKTIRNQWISGMPQGTYSMDDPVLRCVKHPTNQDSDDSFAEKYSAIGSCRCRLWTWSLWTRLTSRATGAVLTCPHMLRKYPELLVAYETTSKIGLHNFWTNSI